MAEDYTVQPGDCLSSIAFVHGFLWQTLWDHPSNAGLKLLRKDPNVLMEGDEVHIPDVTVQDFPRPTDQLHKFVLQGVPEKLRIKLLDVNHQPRANVDYVIVIDGKPRSGKTDANGQLTESIPPDAKSGKLLLGEDRSEEIPLQLGYLDPVSVLSGLKARLANLGFYNGPLDNNLDDKTRQAIRDFQTKQVLPVTGDPDDATQSELLQVHGH